MRLLLVVLPLLVLHAATTSSALAQVPTYLTEWTFPRGDDGVQKVAVGPNGNVYLLFPGYVESIRVYSSDGVPLTTFGVPATHYTDIAFDSQGRLWTVNYNLEVELYTSTGSLVRQWQVPYQDPVLYPYGITIDTQNNVYIIYDPGGSVVPRVDVLDEFGNLLHSWECDISYSVTSNGSNEIFVASPYKITVFSTSGVMLREWGSRGSGPGQFDQIDGIADDGAGNVFVTEHYNSRVQIFSYDGVYMGAFGSYGTGPGQFIYPRDVGIDAAQSGHVYVTDPRNGRVQVFATEPTATDLSTWGRVKALYR